MSISVIGSRLANLNLDQRFEGNAIEAFKQRRAQAEPKTEKKQMSLRGMLRAGYFDNMNYHEMSKIRSIISKQNMDKTSHVHITEAYNHHAQLDSNKNGILTDSELQQQLLSLSSEQITTKNFGTQLLSHYKGVSSLDQSNGISRNDLTQLASGHGGKAVISGLDFYKASSPNGYNSYLQDKAQVYSMVQNMYSDIILA